MQAVFHAVNSALTPEQPIFSREIRSSRSIFS